MAARFHGLGVVALLLFATSSAAQMPGATFGPVSAAPSSEVPTAEPDVLRRLDELERRNDDLARKLTAGGSAKPPAPSAETGFRVGQDLKMSGSWKNGLWFETPDKAFRWAVGGVMQFDTSFFGAGRDVVQSVGVFNNLVDPGLGLQDGFSFRRARLRFSGAMWEQVEFFAQYEFAQALDLRRRTLGFFDPGSASPPPNEFDPGDNVGFNEVYLGLVKLPLLGQVRVGRHRESLNFVTATADNNQVWLERGLMFDAFNGDFNFSNGVTVQNTWLDDQVYALLGLFHANNNTNRGFYAVGDGEYAYDVRLTCLPLYDEGAESWLHVGVDYSYRNPHQDQLRYRARPMVRSGPLFLTPNVIGTGTILTPDAQQIANLEFATAQGRFTFAAEWAASWVTGASTGTLPPGTYFANGGYVEALYFLTPDHRKYVKDRPGYARVVPRSTFYLLEGEDGRLIFSRGAWEVGARYDFLDLTDGGINGGSGSAVTLCLNWYWNPNARVQCNYFWMDRRFAPADVAGRVDGDLHGLGIRFNVDF